MSIKYSVLPMRNPMRPNDPKRFYAKVQTRDQVSLNRIADEISYATSLTDGDVLNVLRALIRKIKEHLVDGDLVSLGELGKFQYQLSSQGTDLEEEFLTSNIRKARIQFRPGAMIKTELSALKFEKTISVKARKLAAKQVPQP